MKKQILKQLSRLCLLIALTAICMPVKAQQNPPNDSVGMGWIYDMYSSGGNFLDIKNRAERFFAAYPEYDTVAEIKNQYLDWLSYWKNRAHWIDSASQPGDMGSAQKAMSRIYTETTISNSALPYLPSWTLKSPIECTTQNMGIVTCTWVNPGDNNNILIGTEASGLWETTDGGINWHNKTETYLQSLSSTNNNNNIPIGFGVSSICVIQKPGLSRMILISTYVPGSSLIIGHGLGILFSYGIGNTVWRRFINPNTAYENIQGLENMNWKIINNSIPTPIGSTNILYASYGEFVYRIEFQDNGTFQTSTRIFDLHNNVGLSNYHIQDIYQKTQKVRDMEILNNQLVITTDGFYQSNQLFANAQIFYAQLIDLNNITTYTNNAAWSHIDFAPQISSTEFVDYIAIDGLNNNLYAAYDVMQLNTNGITDNETFHYDKYNPLGLGWTKEPYANGSYIFSHTSNFYLNNPLAGFGYRFNAFKVIAPKYFYIGGFQLNEGSIGDSGVLEFIIKAATTINNENAAHNDEYHYGIRDFAMDNTGVLYMATEGGISKYSGGVFTNINGKGLVIAQVNSMTTTQNSKYDVIVHNAFRNGLWRYKCNTWDNFYWEDGGNVLLDEIDRDNNDNGEPDYIHNVTSYINWNFPLYPYTTPLNYCRFDNLMGIADVIPDYSYLTYQNIFNNEWNYNSPFEFANSTNDVVYQGLHNIYQSADYGASWTALTANGVNNYPNSDYWSDKLQVIRVAPNNPDIMYIAFSDPTYDLDQAGNSSGNTFPLHKIYRGKKTGNAWNWVDISAGISNMTPSLPGYILKWSGITDIAINPNNPDIIWITFNMFEGSNANNGQYRVLQGIFNQPTNTCSWSDYSNGLTSAPVNCVIYNKTNSNNELFVGTDAGVFYRNSALSSWQLFHTNNPKWIVTDLDINYNNMMLRAANWGRGIWETPIKCNIDILSDQPIYIDKTWDLPMINCGDVKIYAGATLTINANVEMADNKSITVYRGGKLVINNATIKSYCKEMWRGIIVDGDNTLPQTNSISHAYVVINSSNIEDAITGVECIDLNNQQKGGGYIIANNTTFRNNYLSVNLLPYSYMNNYAYVNNLSSFYNCNFIIDQPLKRISNYTPYLYNKKTIYTLVRISGIKGLNIGGCRFKYENQVCNSSYKYRGIVANNSSFFINNGCSSNISYGSPCPASDIIPSVFSGLEYGIYTVGGIDNFTSFSVRNTEFNENRYGLYANGCNNFYLVSNSFKIPFFNINISLNEPNPQKLYYGAYLDACINGYHLEDNLFGDINENIQGFIGLYVNNSQRPLKIIYNNRFTFLTYNFIARGANGAPLQPYNPYNQDQTTGLKIKCNDFTPALFNISIIGDPNPFNVVNGIGVFQGLPSSVMPYQPSFPAGNRWLDCCSNHDIYNECNPILYFRHNDPITIPNSIWNNTFTNSNNITFVGTTDIHNTNISFDKVSACPAIDIHPISPLTELPDLYDGLNTAQQQLNSAKLIYRIWVDGGNTEALRDAINLALPYEAYDLYNNLISRSPYLSDAVMIDAIKREELLPPLMLKIVLLANPQAVKSQSVMDAIYARVNKFPESWIDELKQCGVGVISSREQLEAEIDYTAVNKQLIFNKIVSIYANDTTADYLSDSLIALYQRENTLETDIDLVYFYISHNMLYEAYQLREFIPEKHTIDENMQLYWNNTYTITKMLTSLKYNNKDIKEMDIEDRNQLYDILENPTSKATGIARMLLMQADTCFVYEEPVDLPPDLPQNKTTQPVKYDQKPMEKLEVYPNPANDFVTLTYQTNESLSGLRLIICDVMGKTVYMQALSKPNDYLLIVLKDYAKGNYIASIINNKKTIKTCKFVVQ